MLNQSFDLSLCYEDSAIINPLVCTIGGVRSDGSLLKFVSDQKATLNSISLGQVSPKAAKLIENAMKEGSWVILQKASGHKLDARAGKDLRATKAR